MWALIDGQGMTKDVALVVSISIETDFWTVGDRLPTQRLDHLKDNWLGSDIFPEVLETLQPGMTLQRHQLKRGMTTKVCMRLL
jgi:hypothetical protein